MTNAPTARSELSARRDLDAIDYELRLVADVRQTCRDRGWPVPAFKRADELLDERIQVAP